MNNNNNDQITALQYRIGIIKSQKIVTKLDEFLIEVWERNIRILTKQENDKF